MSINLRDDVIRAVQAKPNKHYKPPASVVKVCCKKCKNKCKRATVVREKSIDSFYYDKTSCPICGEQLKDIYYIEKGELNKGISRGITKQWTEGFLGWKFKEGSLVTCCSCGHEWLEDIHEY